jgi:hypothetical protein
VSPYTHVAEYNGGASVIEMGSRAEADEFTNRLRRFNGTDRFAATLWRLPDGMDYVEARRAGLDALAYVQAAGDGNKFTVEIRKAGGAQWGADWVRYVVGHPHTEPEPLDVAIKLPHSTEIISRCEVFDADEAGKLIYDYYKTGDIPAEYALRPAEGFGRDGRNIDLRDEAQPL